MKFLVFVLLAVAASSSEAHQYLLGARGARFGIQLPASAMSSIQKLQDLQQLQLAGLQNPEAFSQAGFSSVSVGPSVSSVAVGPSIASASSPGSVSTTSVGGSNMALRSEGVRVSDILFPEVPQGGLSPTQPKKSDKTRIGWIKLER